MTAFRARQRGLTLIELMVAVVIVAVISLVLLFALTHYQGRARDSRRKADLDRLKITYEDYYNDHGCYPDPDILNGCGGDALQPYLDRVPCDPFTKAPYVYLPDENNQCKGYRILANLENNEDPVITALKCDTACGCGYGEDFNYGISVGMGLVADSCSPVVQPSASPVASTTPSAPASPQASSNPQPSPSPSANVPRPFACAPDGVCNSYGDPTAAGCPISFAQSNCQNACSNPANRCLQ